MEIEGFRRRMEAWWSDFDSDAQVPKDSQSVTVELIKIYGRLDSEDRMKADRVIGEWVCSDEERKRFDALAVIDEFRIRTAGPQLRVLEIELQGRGDSAAQFELKKVRSVLERLEHA